MEYEKGSKRFGQDIRGYRFNEMIGTQDEIVNYQEETAHHLKWIKYALWYWIIVSWIGMAIGVLFTLTY